MVCIYSALYLAGCVRLLYAGTGSIAASVNTIVRGRQYIVIFRVWTAQSGHHPQIRTLPPTNIVTSVADGIHTADIVLWISIGCAQSKLLSFSIFFRCLPYTTVVNSTLKLILFIAVRTVTGRLFTLVCVNVNSTPGSSFRISTRIRILRGTFAAVLIAAKGVCHFTSRAIILVPVGGRTNRYK